MLALEVHINGKRRCLAGIEGDGVVSAILSWVGRGHPQRGLPKGDVSLRVGGLDSVRREHMDWLEQDLAGGDDVRIRVVDVPKVDRPLKGSTRPADDSTRRQLFSFRKRGGEAGAVGVTATAAHLER